MLPASEMPDSLTAGETFLYNHTVPDYAPGDGWTLTLHVKGPSVIVPIAATVSGTLYLVTIPASVTSPLKPGNYRWEERVTKGTEVYCVGRGTIHIVQNIETASAGDMETWEEKNLAVVQAVLDNRLPEDMQSYQIAGRAVTRIPIKELLALRAELQMAVDAQRHPGKFIEEVKVVIPGMRSERQWPL